MDQMRWVALWFVTVSQLYKCTYIQIEWYGYRKVFHLVIAGSLTLPWNIHSQRTYGILKVLRLIFLWYTMQYWILQKYCLMKMWSHIVVFFPLIILWCMQWHHHSLYRQTILTIDCGFQFVLSARLLWMLNNSITYSLNVFLCNLFVVAWKLICKEETV